jgi:hypothetical protein
MSIEIYNILQHNVWAGILNLLSNLEILCDVFPMGMYSINNHPSMTNQVLVFTIRECGESSSRYSHLRGDVHQVLAMQKWLSCFDPAAEVRLASPSKRQKSLPRHLILRFQICIGVIHLHQNINDNPPICQWSSTRICIRSHGSPRWR